MGDAFQVIKRTIKQTNRLKKQTRKRKNSNTTTMKKQDSRLMPQSYSMKKVNILLRMELFIVDNGLVASDMDTASRRGLTGLSTRGNGGTTKRTGGVFSTTWMGMSSMESGRTTKPMASEPTTTSTGPSMRASG